MSDHEGKPEGCEHEWQRVTVLYCPFCGSLVTEPCGTKRAKHTQPACAQSELLTEEELYRACTADPEQRS